MKAKSVWTNTVRLSLLVVAQQPEKGWFFAEFRKST